MVIALRMWVSLVLLSLGGLGLAVASSEESAEPVTQQWLTKHQLGQVAGIATDSAGNIHVFHRGSRVYDADSFDSSNNFAQKDQGPIKENTHIVIDPTTGEIIHEGGADQFYMPHGLFIDGEDNVWLTDIALHQVLKLSAGSHEPALILGSRFVHGNKTSEFCKPTDVAVSADGAIFVSDGYCNSRVMKFDADGTYMSQFGGHKTKDIPHGFVVPHSLTLIEDWNLICVADRENERVQCFSAELPGMAGGVRKSLAAGVFIQEASHLGRVFAIRSLGHYMVGVTNGGTAADGSYDDSNKLLFVVDLRNGESNTYDVGLENPHCLAIADDESIYVGEIGPNKVTKINL